MSQGRINRLLNLHFPDHSYVIKQACSVHVGHSGIPIDYPGVVLVGSQQTSVHIMAFLMVLVKLIGHCSTIDRSYSQKSLNVSGDKIILSKLQESIWEGGTGKCKKGPCLGYLSCFPGHRNITSHGHLHESYTDTILLLFCRKVKGFHLQIQFTNTLHEC